MLKYSGFNSLIFLSISFEIFTFSGSFKNKRIIKLLQFILTKRSMEKNPRISILSLERSKSPRRFVTNQRWLSAMIPGNLSKLISVSRNVTRFPRILFLLINRGLKYLMRVLRKVRATFITTTLHRFNTLIQYSNRPTINHTPRTMN